MESGIVLDLVNIAVPALFLVLLAFEGKELRWMAKPWFVKRETVPRWVVAPLIGLWLIAAILHAT